MEQRAWFEPSDKELRERVAEALRYRFKDVRLLRQALTHSSYANEAAAPGNNELLEFLGDSVIGMLVAERLYGGCRELAEGGLSKIKAFLVGEKHLAQVFSNTGLADLLHIGKGEAAAGGRTKAAILADACEALVAALYLDGGISAVESLADTWFSLDASLASYARDGRDCKTELQEIIMARMRTRPVYEIVGVSGPQHAPTFICSVSINGNILGEGSGPNKQSAEKNAALAALDAFERHNGGK